MKINRASTISAVAVMTAAAAAAVARANQIAAIERRSNVLLIMCDQLSANALSCYGGPVPSPHIDRLATEGVRFNQAVCPTPFCSPTRASIVTGMYPHAHGIVANCAPGSGPRSQAGLTDEDVTTEKLLQASGYATHHYGKWHLFGDEPSYYPDMFCPHPHYTREMQQVFDRVRKTDASGWMGWYTWALPVEIAPPLRRAVETLGGKWDDARHREFVVDMGRLELPLEQVYDVRLGQMTAERIRKLGRQRTPFMITCSFNWPHDPNVAPSPYYEQFPPERIALPGNRHVREKRFEGNWSRRIVADLGEPGLREFLRIYCATVKLLDDQVGRILDALDEVGLTDHTVIIFTADHGDMMGGHGMVWKSTSAFYDEIARVPLLIRYPAALRPQTCELAVDLTDLMPTILHLVGRPVPKQAQGQNLMPFLIGRQDAGDARRFSFSERVRRHPKGKREAFPGRQGDFMIRGQGWKYVRYSSNDEYLYHLADDPGETRNLAHDPKYSSRKKEMVEELNAWLARTGWTSP